MLRFMGYSPESKGIVCDYTAEFPLCQKRTDGAEPAHVRPFAALRLLRRPCAAAEGLDGSLVGLPLLFNGLFQ